MQLFRKFTNFMSDYDSTIRCVYANLCVMCTAAERERESANMTLHNLKVEKTIKIGVGVRIIDSWQLVHWSTTTRSTAHNKYFAKKNKQLVLRNRFDIFFLLRNLFVYFNAVKRSQSELTSVWVVNRAANDAKWAAIKRVKLTAITNRWNR